MSAKKYSALLLAVFLFGCQKSEVEKCTEATLAGLHEKVGKALIEGDVRMQCMKAQAGQN